MNNRPFFRHENRNDRWIYEMLWCGETCRYVRSGRSNNREKCDKKHHQSVHKRQKNRLVGEKIRALSCHIQDVSDSKLAQFSQIARIPLTAQIQVVCDLTRGLHLPNKHNNLPARESHRVQSATLPLSLPTLMTIFELHTQLSNPLLAFLEFNFEFSLEIASNFCHTDVVHVHVYRNTDTDRRARTKR